MNECFCDTNNVLENVLELVWEILDNDTLNNEWINVCKKIKKTLEEWGKSTKTAKENCLVHRIKIKKHIELLKDYINIDWLTKLYNSSYLANCMRKLLKNKEEFKIIFLDLDNFKIINDKEWHIVWDILLQEVAKLLLTIFTEPEYIVCRKWWDEFVIISLEKEEELILEDLQKLLDKFTKSWVLFIDSWWNENCCKNMKFSYWIASSNEKYDKDRDDEVRWLISLADIRMYQNKRNKKYDSWII
jgi:diguanylate cyclase (GGDEF)-like protein